MWRLCKQASFGREPEMQSHWGGSSREALGCPPGPCCQRQWLCRWPFSHPGLGAKARPRLPRHLLPETLQVDSVLAKHLCPLAVAQCDAGRSLGRGARNAPCHCKGLLPHLRL